MTREEARVKLCTTPVMVLEGNVTQYEEAVKLAIEALQERPKGRWIELPCEIGDTVFSTNDEDQEIYEATVTGFEINAHGLYINSDYEIGTRADANYLFYTRKKAEESVYGADMKGE